MWAGLCLRGPQRSLSTVTVPAICTVYEKGWKLKSCWAKLGSCGRRELHILPPYTLQKIQSRFSLRAGFTLRSDCCSILLEGAHSCPRVLPSFLRAPSIAGGSAVRMTPHQLLSTRPRSQATASGLLTPGVTLRMGLQRQRRDHVIEGQRLVS